MNTETPKTLLLTLGTFDTPHMGHAIFLRRCERFADRVVVGVNSDEFVESFKGVRPVYGWEERATLIRDLGYEVVSNPSAGREVIGRVKPDVLAIGSDWARRDYYAQIDVDQDWLDLRGITMVYIPYTPGISSTDLKERLGGR